MGMQKEVTCGGLLWKRMQTGATCDGLRLNWLNCNMTRFNRAPLRTCSCSLRGRPFLRFTKLLIVTLAISEQRTAVRTNSYLDRMTVHGVKTVVTQISHHARVSPCLLSSVIFHCEVLQPRSRPCGDTPAAIEHVAKSSRKTKSIHPNRAPLRRQTTRQNVLQLGFGHDEQVQRLSHYFCMLSLRCHIRRGRVSCRVIARMTCARVIGQDTPTQTSTRLNLGSCRRSAQIPAQI